MEVCNARHIPFEGRRCGAVFPQVSFLLEKHSIPEEHRRWYVRRLEAFIEAQKGHKIKSLSGADIDRYLETIGR